MKLDTKVLKTITILYVEDESEIREQVAHFLEKIFKKVYVAIDGEDGLKKFIPAQKEIDIIITDINMPKISGFDMIKSINRLCAHNNKIPSIVTTAHNDTEHLLNAIDNNVKKYIEKPFELRNLTILIVKFVTESRKKRNIEKLAKGLAFKYNKNEKITTTLNNEVNILRKQNLFQTTLINDFIIHLDIDKTGNIIEASSKFYNTFGYSEDEIIGKHINIIRCKSSDQLAFQKLMLRAIHLKDSVNGSFVFTTNEQKDINSNIIMIPFFDKSNLVSGYKIYIDTIID